MPGRLSEDEIERDLNSLAGWGREGEEIRKQFSFSDFRGSMAFVNAVAIGRKRQSSSRYHHQLQPCDPRSFEYATTRAASRIATSIW